VVSSPTGFVCWTNRAEPRRGTDCTNRRRRRGWVSEAIPNLYFGGLTVTPLTREIFGGNLRIEQIVEMEASNEGVIHLVRDRLFWQAWEKTQETR